VRTSLTVIIPTLNAADTLAATLATVRGQTVIVVDGGSSDRTVAIAHEHDIETTKAPRGRGPQLRVGVAAADTPWVLLLHADTRPARDWPAAARSHMAAWPDHAGYFDFALDTNDPRARRLEQAVAWRCRRFALPYGDQGLLVRKAVLAAVGGIRPLPLMEDVDLARRLGAARLRRLGCPALTSPARWEGDGWRRRSAKNLLCLSMFRCGVPPVMIRRLYG